MSGFSVAGSAYDRFMGRYSSTLAGRLCDAAAVPAGARALDVGCGPGALAAELSVRGCRVSAIDPSEPFVAACRERVPDADVRVGSAEALPYDDGAFEIALAQLVVNFMPDAPAGVREMRRVVRPGGTVGAAVWDYAGGMTMLRAFWDAAATVCAGEGAVKDEGRVTAHLDAGGLGDLWAQAGLADVGVQPLQVTAAYDDFDDLWWPFTQGVGPAGAFTAAQPEAVREALRREFHTRVGAPDGPFELGARAWCVIGRA